MGIQTEQYTGEPILIVTLSGTITYNDITQMYAQSDAQAAAIDNPTVWRIIDMTAADIQFPDVMNIIRHLNPDEPGSFADSRFRSLFGGLHPMASLIRDMLAKDANGGLDVPVFPGLGEALIFAEDEFYGMIDANV